MISCTVENRAKDLILMNSDWKDAIKITDDQEVLQEILRYLEDLKKQDKLNNTLSSYGSWIFL